MYFSQIHPAFSPLQPPLHYSLSSSRSLPAPPVQVVLSVYAWVRNYLLDHG